MSIQVLRGAPAVIGVTLVDQNGSARDALGDVTCTVARSDSTVLHSSLTTTAGVGTGQISVSLPIGDTSILDLLRLTWSEDGGATFDTIVEVIGGYMFSIAEARASNSTLRDETKYSDTDLIAARLAVAEECEGITCRSVVPRFKRVRLDGRYRQSIRLPDFDVRRVRSLIINGVAETPDVLAMLIVQPHGDVILGSGAVYPWGEANIEIAYEYGVDEPPQRVREAGLVRLQSFASLTRVGVPDRADFQIIDGKLFAPSAPGVRGSLTGIREVDSAYQSFAVRGGDSMAVPIG